MTLAQKNPLLKGNSSNLPCIALVDPPNKMGIFTIRATAVSMLFCLVMG